jgi:hypothetical protein
MPGVKDAQGRQLDRLRGSRLDASAHLGVTASLSEVVRPLLGLRLVMRRITKLAAAFLSRLRAMIQIVEIEL